MAKKVLCYKKFRKKVFKYNLNFYSLAMGHEAGSMSHSTVEGEPDDYNTQCHHHYHHLTQGLRQLELSPTNSTTNNATAAPWDSDSPRNWFQRR